MLKPILGAILVAAIPTGAVAQAATNVITYGGNTTKPVAQTPAVDPADTPEEIAKDAARDLKDTSYYNKPGATRAQYDADWQTCRLIARGSRTPSGTIINTYNPAVVSPIAAGVGGAVGGMFAAMLAEGAQRRMNRQACLMIKGWRRVELPAAEAAKVRLMPEADRLRALDRLVGAVEVTGEVTERTSFTVPEDPALDLTARPAGAGSVFLGKKVDAAAPFALAQGEGAVVLAFRRAGERSINQSASVQLVRYDMAARDLVYQPRDWKKTGDKTTYVASVESGDKHAPYEVQVVRLTPGDYVINGLGIARLPIVSTNCFGAPTFHVGAGEVVYLGDFVPFVNVKLATGMRTSLLAYTSHLDEARAALATRQLALAGVLKPAALRNRATYACSAVTMDRWDIAGLDSLTDADAAPALH